MGIGFRVQGCYNGDIYVSIYGRESGFLPMVTEIKFLNPKL